MTYRFVYSSLIVIALASALLASFSGLASLIILVIVSCNGSFRHLLVPSFIPRFMAAWLVWLPISTLWAYSTGLALDFAALLLGLPLAWLAGRSLHEQGRLLPLLEKVVPVSLACLIMWGLWQGPMTVSLKPSGPFNDANTYAAALNLLLLPILSRYLCADLNKCHSVLRTAMLGLVGATGLMFFLVASRGAGLVLLLMLPILIWQARNRPQFTQKLLLLLMVYVVAYLSAMAINTVGHSLFNRLGLMAFNSVGGIEKMDGGRWILMASTWQMIQDHPWLGSGLGSFQYLYPPYRYFVERGSSGSWAHNDYLQFWQEGGIVSLVLLLALLGWVVWRLWQELRHSTAESLVRLGYLTALLATLLQASVNFILYFSAVAVMLGLYLAALTPLNPVPRSEPPPARHWRLLAGGYALILGYLMLGMVAVDGLLGQKQFVQRALAQVGVAYPVFDTGVFLSIASPFHHGPSLVLADEMSELWQASGRQDPNMLAGALSELETSLRLLPCNPKAYGRALYLLSQAPRTPALQDLARHHIDQALTCNARSGITYFHAGLLVEAQSPALALDYWRAGLAASVYGGERKMLAAQLLAREMPQQKVQLEAIAHELARVWLALLSDQPTGVTRGFGVEMERRLRSIGGKRYAALMLRESF